MKFHFFNRVAGPGHPGGKTVSKRAELPAGDFRITEYSWGRVSLWFVDGDKFTADERQAAFAADIETEQAFSRERGNGE